MAYLYKMTTIALFLFALNGLSQTQIDYVLESDLFSIQETENTFSSKIIKEGDTLKWEQHINGATNVVEYHITGVSGNWDTNASQGNLSYSLSKAGFSSASFALSGPVQGGLEATLTLKSGEQPSLTITFNITNITYP